MAFRIVLFPIALFLTGLAAGQVRSVRIDISSANVCGAFPSVEQKIIDVYDTDPDDKARLYVEMICKAIEATPNFIVKRASISNAMSTCDALNNRYIYYSLDFFQNNQNKWGLIAVLAHEIGHHINNHTLSKGGHRREDELAADAFAGSILCKLHGNLKDAKILLDQYCSTQETDLYPSKLARLAALSEGYDRAGCTLDNIDQPIEATSPGVSKAKEAESAELSLQLVNSNEFFTRVPIYTNEFDEEKGTFVSNNSIIIGAQRNGLLEVGRNSRNYFGPVINYKDLERYEFETQVCFASNGYLNTTQQIPKLQYFVWDGTRSNGLIKGFYFSPYQESKYDPIVQRWIPTSWLEIGYMDGDTKTVIDKLKIDDDYSFAQPDFVKVLIKKSGGSFYIFTNDFCRGRLHFVNYIPGDGFAVINSINWARGADDVVLNNQLNSGSEVKVNYVRVNNLILKSNH
jgi:hypothetical protein